MCCILGQEILLSQIHVNSTNAKGCINVSAGRHLISQAGKPFLTEFVYGKNFPLHVDSQTRQANSFSVCQITNTTYLAFLSSDTGGLVLWYLSPILIPPKCPTSDTTSPVASSRPRRSISERSACNTRLEFCKNLK